MKEEITIFDLLYPKYKINKPVRLIELFGGYGSQALALKYLGVDFEHWKLCEWAIKSIQAYKDIHFENDNNDYSASFDIDFIKKFLIDRGISQNYNEPMTKEKIEKMSENYAREIFNNIIVTRNLVNISQVKGKDLEITNTDKYDYILTYSFPCQDLSLAGKGKGMKDTSTRSGLLWEVERILGELDEKPQILLMENVPQVHSQDNLEDFKKWILKLEEFGYKNYFEDLIATDYGIPQTRNRCFMVSILGDYSYTFPPRQKLKLKLKDLLEEKVDKKYFLSDKMLSYIVSKDDKYKVNENSLQLNRDIAVTKTTREGRTRADTSDYIGVFDYSQSDTLRPTLESRTHINSNVSGSLLASGNHNGLLMKSATKVSTGLKQIGQLYGTEREPNPQDGRIYDSNGLIPTLMSGGQKVPKIAAKNLSETVEKNIDKFKNGKVLNLDLYNKKVNEELSQTLTLPNHNTQRLFDGLRIRKLTPRECFRLMGVKDEDFDKVSKKQSDSSLYHLAGDSIVVNVLMAIFKQLL